MSAVASANRTSLGKVLGRVLGRVLGKALAVGGNELSRALRLLSLIFATSAALALLKAAQGGVFLAAYPRSAIPRAFAVSALSLAAASSVSVAAAARLGPVSLATFGLALSSLALVVAWAALSPFLVYVVVETICGIVLIQVWSVVSETVDARSAKRLLPIAGVGASLAWTIFGLLTPRLVARVGASGLLLLAPALLVGALLVVRAIAAIDLAGRPAKGGARTGLLDGWREGFRFVAEVPLMRVVLTLSVLALVAEQLMDFLLLAAAREGHASSSEIAGFLGRFHGVVSGVSLVVLLGLSSRVLSRLGAILGLLATPLATVLAAALAIAVPGLLPVVLLRGVDRVLKNALFTSAMEQTQTPLPVVRRAQARALIRGVVAPLFYALSAVLLATIPEDFDLRVLALLTLLLATAMGAVIVVALRPRYVLALRQAIDDRRLRLDPDLTETKGASVPIDVDACRALGRELADPDEARALLAAEVLGHGAGPAAADALAVGLQHPSAEVRAESANGLGQLRAMAHAPALAALLANDPISEVRRAAIRALIALGGERVADFERARSDTDRVVRAAATIALLRREDPRGVESGEALLPLLDGHDRELCEAALEALGRSALRHPPLLDAVRTILRSDDRHLRVRALEAVTRTRTRELLADVAPLLEDAATAPDAVARLAHWGEGALDAAAESVATTSVSHEAEAAPMSRLLSHADPAVRDRAARALIRSPRKLLPRDAVGPVLDRELSRAYRLEATRVSVVGGVGAGPADPTLVAEIELRFREAKNRVLQLLALRESRKLVEVVEAGLRRPSPAVAAQIAELLDVALRPELARKVVPLFDRLDGDARVTAAIEAGVLRERPAGDDPLGALVALDDPHLRGCALAAHGSIFAARFPELHAAEAAMIPVYERMRFLRSVPLFSELPGEDLRTIAEIVETTDVRAGEAVFRKGDPGDDLYVILTGRIAIRDGRTELALMGPREFFGELSVIDREPRSADAVVVEDAQLLRLRSSDLGELMARRPQIQEQVLIVLARRLRAVSQRVTTQ